MTLIEDRSDRKKNIFKKDTQIRLAIAELMGEQTPITVKRISQKTKISVGSIRNYVQNLERSGDLIIERQGKDKKSEILHMQLTEEAIGATYDQFITWLPENGIERFLALLEEKINGNRKLKY